MRVARTYNIKSGSSIAAGTHEGCCVELTDVNEVDLNAAGTSPCGIIESIDGTTCVVVVEGDVLGKAGATITVGTHAYLTSAADSRLDPASAGQMVIARVLGDADAADGHLIPVYVHIFELET
jgi:hypothetical protein